MSGLTLDAADTGEDQRQCVRGKYSGNSSSSFPVAVPSHQATSRAFQRPTSSLERVAPSLTLDLRWAGAPASKNRAGQAEDKCARPSSVEAPDRSLARTQSNFRNSSASPRDLALERRSFPGEDEHRRSFCMTDRRIQPNIHAIPSLGMAGIDAKVRAAAGLRYHREFVPFASWSQNIRILPVCRLSGTRSKLCRVPSQSDSEAGAVEVGRRHPQAE